MKAFVINLDSRPDRMKRFKENIFPFEVERFSGIKASCGEDGCTYSHLLLLSEQQKFPFIIFEDDSIMLQSWGIVEKAISQLINTNWDMLYLGANLRRSLERYSENTFRLNKAYAAHAIIYNSKQVVDYILNNHNTPSGQNLDIFYHHVIQEKFNCFITYPMVMTQLSDYSDIAKVDTNNAVELIVNYKKFTNEISSRVV